MSNVTRSFMEEHVHLSKIERVRAVRETFGKPLAQSSDCVRAFDRLKEIEAVRTKNFEDKVNFLLDEMQREWQSRFIEVS